MLNASVKEWAFQDKMHVQPQRAAEARSSAKQPCRSSLSWHAWPLQVFEEAV